MAKKKEKRNACTKRIFLFLFLFCFSFTLMLVDADTLIIPCSKDWFDHKNIKCIQIQI